MKIKIRMILLALCFIFIGMIIVNQIYSRYPAALFTKGYQYNDSLNAAIFSSVVNFRGKCARVTPSTFYESLSSAKSAGYSAISYINNLDTCKDYDEAYTGKYFIVYQNFTENFCGKKNK